MALRVALGQFNACVGDITGNVAKMRDFYAKGIETGADLVIFPEMAICGYPPEDLLLKTHFFEDNMQAVEQMAKDCSEKTLIVGFAEATENRHFNSLAVLDKGTIKRIYRKMILPNYGVFDERRYFRSGSGSATVRINGHAVILTICEDIWHVEWMDEFIGETYRKDLIVNISASPFHVGKIGQRKDVLSRCAKYFNCPVAYCNLIGGQDELVFDGRSMFLDAKGTVTCQANAFEEDLLIADVDSTLGDKVCPVNSDKASINPIRGIDHVSEIYQALVLGTRDYVLKNGFSKVVIGLSGGIDSSLTAAIAVDALGAESVVGVTMPSKFNSPETIRDAAKVAKKLGIEFHIIPIKTVLDEFNSTLKCVGDWSDAGIAYENLQARIRGTILMSLSNQFSYLVLTTGNKSETAVGYCTLYGDTAGGFAVIKDVPKMMVYKLARYANWMHGQAIIPTSVLKRAPSAELKDGQMDTDSLPDYDLLDKILKGCIEEDKSAQKLIEEGLPKDIVSQVIRMVDLNEYKRRQSPPGVKITPKAFGKDRRMPITNCYISR
ncbi:MAG: NAD+ synthase [Phycisphaerae bacterium]|nr:NAD+ synthase [Phycisphaerae bacterium]